MEKISPSLTIKKEIHFEVKEQQKISSSNGMVVQCV